MKPIQFPAQSEEHLQALDELYRTTRNVRLRTRAQMILLAAEQHLTAAAIAAIVRESENTVRCWLKRSPFRRNCWITGCLGRWSATQSDSGLPGFVAAGREASASQPGPAVFDVDVTAIG